MTVNACAQMMMMVFDEEDRTEDKLHLLQRPLMSCDEGIGQMNKHTSKRKNVGPTTAQDSTRNKAGRVRSGPRCTPISKVPLCHTQPASAYPCSPLIDTQQHRRYNRENYLGAQSTTKSNTSRAMGDKWSLSYPVKITKYERKSVIQPTRSLDGPRERASFGSFSFSASSKTRQLYPKSAAMVVLFGFR